MSYAKRRNILVSNVTTSDKSIMDSVRLFAYHISFDLKNLQLNRFFQHTNYNSMMATSSIFTGCSEDTRQFCYDFLDAVHVTILEGRISLYYEFSANDFAEREYPNESEEIQRVYAAQVEALIKDSEQLVLIDQLYTGALLKWTQLDIAPAPTANKKPSVLPGKVDPKVTKILTQILEGSPSLTPGMSDESNDETDDSDVEDLDMDQLRRPAPKPNSMTPIVDAEAENGFSEDISVRALSTPEPMDIDSDSELLLPKKSDFSPERNAEAKEVVRPEQVERSGGSVWASYGSVWHSVTSECANKDLAGSNDSTSPGAVIDFASQLSY
jgi:hypothetical protein